MIINILNIFCEMNELTNDNECWVWVMNKSGDQQLIQIMSFQNNDSSDLDFSIIDKKPPQQAKLNFSVESLLDERSRCQQSQSQSPSVHRNTNQIVQNQQSEQECPQPVVQNGSFLNDLQKLQHQLSFQTQLFNVYQQQTQTLHSHSLNPTNKSCLHAKSNSHLKTTKEESSNSRLHLDDYGYLVLDFSGDAKKKRKQIKGQEKEKLSKQKLYTQQSTSNSQKLKLSSSSAALTQNVSMAVISTKPAKGSSKHKNSSLNKLFSPRIGKKSKKSQSKDKPIFNPITTAKSKDPKKHTQPLNQKHQKSQKSQKSQKLILSKGKSPSHHLLNTSKKTTVSTIINQTTTHKSNKSYTKSTRQGNAYSEYYGFEEMGESQRLVMKSNCLHSCGSEKRIGVGKGSTKYLVKKSSSKSGCKQSFHSPSSKDLTMRFKKKKTNQTNLAG